MSATSVTFDGNSIQSANVLTNKIQHTDYSRRVLNRERKSQDDGFDLLDNYFSERIIIIRGSIKGSSASDLDSQIDTLKENLGGQEKNLDISFGGSTRRYVATVSDLRIPEEYYHLTVVPYEVEFICQPFGRDTSETNHSNDGITSSPESSSLSISGTASPRPKITITIVSETSMTAIKFENTTTSESITITRSFSAGEVLEIDTENKTVEVDDTEVDFSGVFPEFLPGTNSYTLTITDGGAFEVNLDIDYTSLYL